MVLVDSRDREPPSELGARAAAERLTGGELHRARRLADDRDAVCDGSRDDGACSLEISRGDTLRACADPCVKSFERSCAVSPDFIRSCQLDDYCRGAGIRTRDLLNPIQARYQAAPHPGKSSS